MAHLQANLGELDSLVNGIAELAEQIDNIADEILDENVDQLVNALSNQIASAAKDGHGGLAGSIQPIPARKNAYGHFTVARPEGADEQGNDYADRLKWFEYGNGRSSGHPVRSAAAASVQGSVEAAIMARVEEVVEQYCK